MERIGTREVRRCRCWNYVGGKDISISSEYLASKLGAEFLSGNDLAS